METCRDIYGRLSRECSAGDLSSYSLGAVIGLIEIVWYNIAAKYKVLQEKAGDRMRGHVLDLDVVVAHREGKTEEKIEGEDSKLISLICRKLAKGRKVEEIAKDLDENVVVIMDIVAAASPFDPKDYDIDVIRRKWRGKSGHHLNEIKSTSAIMA